MLVRRSHPQPTLRMVVRLRLARLPPMLDRLLMALPQCRKALHLVRRMRPETPVSPRPMVALPVVIHLRLRHRMV